MAGPASDHTVDSSRSEAYRCDCDAAIKEWIIVCEYEWFRTHQDTSWPWDTTWQGTYLHACLLAWGAGVSSSLLVRRITVTLGYVQAKCLEVGICSCSSIVSSITHLSWYGKVKQWQEVATQPSQEWGGGGASSNSTVIDAHHQLRVGDQTREGEIGHRKRVDRICTTLLIFHFQQPLTARRRLLEVVDGARGGRSLSRRNGHTAMGLSSRGRTSPHWMTNVEFIESKWYWDYFLSTFNQFPSIASRKGE